VTTCECPLLSPICHFLLVANVPAGTKAPTRERGDVRTGTGTVTAPGLPSPPTRVSVGMAYEASQDRLWVAGRGPGFGLRVGDVRVYHASTGVLLATFIPPGSVGASRHHRPQRSSPQTCHQRHQRHPPQLTWAVTSGTTPVTVRVGADGGCRLGGRVHRPAHQAPRSTVTQTDPLPGRTSPVFGFPGLLSLGSLLMLLSSSTAIRPQPVVPATESPVRFR
jgi:hypothetical protein